MVTRREHAFPPASRLRKSADFQRLRTASIKIHTRHFLIVLEPGTGEESRLGITVSTKIDKRATQRNRIKRLVREVFRSCRKRLSQRFDIVVIARKNVADYSLDEAKKELLGAMAHRGFLLDGTGSRKES